jgi:hypothetical protein
MIFQRCKTCQVGVHNECYGIPGDSHVNVDFQCHACRAVGTTVTVRERDPTGKRITYTIKERPTECCLCSVDDGSVWYHAMHPIYDHYGPTGRQLVLPPSDAEQHPVSRLAWGHTLCCFAISSHSRTGGCVYGCTADGGYDGDDDDDVNSDTSSVNSDLDDTDDESIHHFVYCIRLKKNEPDSLWTKTIKEQQELKCHICGGDDKGPSSFRIPLQCSANDENEFEDFKRIHSKNLGRDTCYVSMHVGCAIWGRNDAGQLPDSRRVYYFPGRDDTVVKQDPKKRFTNTVTNIFCPVHAQDLVRGRIRAAGVLKYPAHLLPRQTAPVVPAATTAASTVDRTVTATTNVNHTVTDADHQRLAHAVERRGQARFVTECRGHGNIGDVRSRLGLRIPDDRITPVAPPTAASLKRKAAPSSGQDRPTTKQQKGLRRPSNDVPVPDQELSVKQQAARDKVCRTIQANVIESLSLVDTNNAEAVDTIRKQRRKHWKQSLLEKGLTSKQCLDLWNKAWKMVTAELETTSTVGANRRAVPEETAGPAGREVDSSVSRPSASPRQDAADLIKTILNEITANEERGIRHLETVLTESKSRWRAQLDYSPAEFQVLWESVLKEILTELGYYSTQESDWTSFETNGLTKWDTVEVLCLGHVPDKCKDA